MYEEFRPESQDLVVSDHQSDVPIGAVITVIIIII